MLPIASRRKKLRQEPDFEHPPLWIHESAAGRLFASRRNTVSSKREAKRRALLELIDRIPLKSAAPVTKPAQAKAPAGIARQPARPAPLQPK